MSGIISGKVWGKTQTIHANHACEMHRLEAVAGAECSKHCHEHKWNGFFVESGKLMIRVWKNDYDLVDETILGPGDWTTTKPGEYHQFVCIEDCVAFELYWTSPLDHSDIVRKSVGSAKDKKPKKVLKG